MSLNGIDISRYQDGINLSAVPADFVIVKATEGTSYKYTDIFTKLYDSAKSAGKLLGAYHYSNGGDYKAEADYFLSIVGNRIGECLLCLDWEGTGNKLFNTGKDNQWIKNWCDYVYNKTKVKPLVYVSKAYLNRVEGIGDYGLWVAQYANNNTTGYQDTPWNEGAYTCVIRQYSSHGRLSGYNGNLDLDKFYGNIDDWKAYANPSNSSSVPGGSDASSSTGTSAPSGTTLDLVVGVMQGRYGDGDARIQSLGTRYDEVQSMINHIATADANTLAKEVLAGTYGNGDIRKIVLGSRYDEVQKVVNQGSRKSNEEIANEVIAGKWGDGNSRKSKLQAAGYDYSEIQSLVNKKLGASSSSSSSDYYTIQSGDTLSEIAAANNTTVSKLQSLNGIKNANKIYAGQKIRIR